MNSGRIFWSVFRFLAEKLGAKTVGSFTESTNWSGLLSFRGAARTKLLVFEAKGIDGLSMFPSDVVSFSDCNHLLEITPSLDDDESLLFAGLKYSLKFLFEMLEVSVAGKVDILLHFTIGGKELKSAFGGNIQTVVLGLGDDGSLDHIASAKSFFVLLVCENILAGDHGLGGAVFTWLGSGERDDLARELSLHHKERTGLSAAGFD